MLYHSLSNRPPRRKFANDEPSMTIQAAADECDINKMIQRYQCTGSYHTQSRSPSVPPQFGDFADLQSYQDAQNTLLEAHELFAGLPAVIRDRFRNDPSQLLSFLEDKSNLEEAVKLGICVAPPVPEPEPQKD